MNTIICMQSPIITRLTRRIDEHLNMNDIPVNTETRSHFLSKIMKIDFTTLHSFRNADGFLGNDELFEAYLTFSNAVVDNWDKPPSFRSIVVLSIDPVNVKIAVDVI